MHNRGITIFRRKFFVSQCRKIFVGGGGSFSVSLISGTEKIWIRGGGEGEYQDFPSNFYLTVPKHFIGKHFGVVSEKFFHRNFSCIGGAGGITVLSELFVSQCRKISWASLQCFRKFGTSKTFMHNRGYHNFPSKIFCLTVPKNFVGILLNVSENLGYR